MLLFMTSKIFLDLAFKLSNFLFLLSSLAIRNVLWNLLRYFLHLNAKSILYLIASILFSKLNRSYKRRSSSLVSYWSQYFLRLFLYALSLYCLPGDIFNNGTLSNFIFRTKDTNSTDVWQVKNMNSLSGLLQQLVLQIFSVLIILYLLSLKFSLLCLIF